MSLRESQAFFYDLCAKPETIVALKKDTKKVLAKYFLSHRDRQHLASYPAERFQTYRNHISYGILGGISSCFPVLKSLVGPKDWNDLLNEFYLKRLTRSPIARRVFGEFSQFLRSHYRGPLLKKLPYLKELAEYEHLELKLFFEKESPRAPKREDLAHELPSNTDVLLSFIPILNPYLETRLYRWPVHHISRDHWKPSLLKRGTYGLIVYRDPETLKVRFVEANPPLLDVIAALAKKPPLRKLTDLFSTEVFAALGFLKEKNILIGYKGRS